MSPASGQYLNEFLPNKELVVCMVYIQNEDILLPMCKRKLNWREWSYDTRGTSAKGNRPVLLKHLPPKYI